MMKKKSMAVAVAAVTVATSVAPAFADNLQGTVVSTNDTQKYDALKAQLQGYFDTTYTTDKADLLNDGNAGQSAYTINANKNEKATTPMKDMKALEDLLASLKNGEYVNISVTNKGFNKIDGQIVDYKIENYTEDSQIVTPAQSSSDKEVKAQAESVQAPVESVQAQAEKLLRNTSNPNNPVIAVDVTNKNTVSIELANNETPLVVTVGDAELDFSKPVYKVDEFGNKLDKDNKITKNLADAVVLGFEKQKSKLVPKISADNKENKEFDYDNTPMNFAVKAGDINEKEYKVADLYNTEIGRFTSEGNKLIKFIEKYNKDNASTPITAEKSNDGLSVVINVPVAPKQSINANTIANYATITVNGTAKEINSFADALNLTNLDGSGATVKTIGGTNRVQTAIEVSQTAFPNANQKGQNVVLVSEYAIADGLTATPFAKQKTAPILLTNKDKISDDVMAEIQRVLGTDGKVYLVGGDAVLSTNIEDQLGAKNINFERIKGKNREATSLEIAKQMKATDKVFVAGGHGEADAMSVANVAATKEAPILLVGQNGLSDDQARFVKYQNGTTEAYIIGGDARVPASVDGQVKDLVEKDAKVNRIEGKRRQDTNAKVIDTFYEGKTINQVYVAKSDDKGLVDALPGGVLAATTDTTPVVLATDEVNTSQEAVLTKLAPNAKVVKTQIGYGVAASVWEVINSIFNK